MGEKQARERKKLQYKNFRSEQEGIKAGIVVQNSYPNTFLWFASSGILLQILFVVSMRYLDKNVVRGLTRI